MSDLGRKDLTEQAKEAVIPDSQKSTTEKAKEGMTNAGDNVASAVEPESEKSTTQKANDEATGIVDAATKKLSEAADVASDQIKKTADYVVGTTASNDKSPTIEANDKSV